MGTKDTPYEVCFLCDTTWPLGQETAPALTADSYAVQTGQAEHKEKQLPNFFQDKIGQSFKISCF